MNENIWERNYGYFFRIYYREIIKIWESKKPKKITIYDILAKQKALTLLARVNNSTYKVNAKSLSAHNHSVYGRHSRSAKINHTVDYLYKEVQIKNVFPKITRPELKQLLIDFTNQNIERISRKDDRIDLIKIRKTKRLLPLTTERYSELMTKSDAWFDAVHAVLSIARTGYADKYRLKALHEKTKETIYRLDEKPNNRLKEEERKYA